MEKPLRLVALCRVSGAAQEDNTSLADQEERIRYDCKAHGHHLVKVIAKVETGFDFSKRKALKEALDYCRQGYADGIIVYSIDRFSRSLMSGLGILELMRQRGWTFISVLDRFDSTSSNGRFIMQVMMSGSEWVRSSTVDRFERGRSFRLKQIEEDRQQTGKKSLRRIAGRAPYGFKSEKGTLKPNPDEMPTLELMIKLRAEGMTKKQIAEYLTREGIPKRRANCKNKFGKPVSNKWYEQQVQRILNEAKAYGIC